MTLSFHLKIKLLLTILICSACLQGSPLYLSGEIRGIYAAGDYVVTGTVYVLPGDTLQIVSGSHVYFDRYGEILVRGVLIAQGTKDSSIVFTSKKDGIYKNQGEKPASLDWNGVKAGEEAVAVILTNVKICYSSYGIEIEKEKTSLQLRKVIFSENGLSNVVIGGNEVVLKPNLESYLIHKDSQPIKATIEKLKKMYTILTGSKTGDLASGDYIVDGTLNVPEGKQLVFHAPSNVRFTPNSSILVAGALSTIGEENKKVNFTSYRDGTPKEISGFGPAPEDWAGIRGKGNLYAINLSNAAIAYSTFAIATDGDQGFSLENFSYGYTNGRLKPDGTRSYSEGPADIKKNK